MRERLTKARTCNECHAFYSQEGTCYIDGFENEIKSITETSLGPISNYGPKYPCPKPLTIDQYVGTGIMISRTVTRMNISTREACRHIWPEYKGLERD